MQKIRVLHVTDKLAFGASTFIRDLMIADLFENIEFFLLILRRSSYEVDIDFKNIIRTQRRRYDPLSFLDIYRIAKKNGIDILHLHLTKSNIVGTIASLLGGWKVVVHMHSFLKKTHRYGGGRFLDILFLRLFKNRVSKFIAISNCVKNELIDIAHIPPGKIKVIYYGMPIKDFKKANRSKSRAAIGVKKDWIVLGYLGRLDEEKGCQYLIEAVKSLSNLTHPILLLIIGDGKLHRTLLEMAHNLGKNRSAAFLGFQKDIVSICPAIDIAIIPSIREPLGKVALEFMAMRIPIIASDTGGLRELIKSGKNGLLVKGGSIEELSNAIDRLITDVRLREKLASNGYRFIKNFDVQEISPFIEKLYVELSAQ